MQTDIHALSRIRTHDPCIRESEDSSCLRLRGRKKYLRRSNAENMGSNPTRAMDGGLPMLSFADSGLAILWSPVHEALSTGYNIHNFKINFELKHGHATRHTSRKMTYVGE
jgi:hypothetical protein